MRVTIDEAKCTGHGRCFALAPGIFDVDELGQGIVIGDGEITPADEGAARLAEQNCPEYAISLVE
jgi:ferredoxin